MTDTSPEAAVQELYKRLASTLNVLSDVLTRSGLKIDREDETLAMGSLALLEARRAGLFGEDGQLTERFGIVPIDDDYRPHSDSMLPDGMVDAGIDVADRVQADRDAYVAGETTDWDDGMVAVATYRAMVRAARTRPYVCRLDIDGRGRFTEIKAVSHADAVRLFALNTFMAAQGEWMGGTVLVAAGPVRSGEEDCTELFLTPWDATIEFIDADRRTVATVARKPAIKA